MRKDYNDWMIVIIRKEWANNCPILATLRLYSSREGNLLYRQLLTTLVWHNFKADSNPTPHQQIATALHSKFR